MYKMPTEINLHVISQSRDDLATSLPSYRDSILVHVDDNEWESSSDSPAKGGSTTCGPSSRFRPTPYCTKCKQLTSRLKRSQCITYFCLITSVGFLICTIIIFIELYGCLSS